MVRSIAVIGCGSLGGYLAQSISQLDEMSEIILVDYDRVELKNINNSIYRREDVGEFKVVVLKKIITFQRSDIRVTTIDQKYVERETYIPKTDLTIDCRDFIYDRLGLIDVRLYISSRYLIVDGRQDVKYEAHHRGRYIQELTKTDLRNAAFSASLFIHKGLITDVTRKRLVHKIELDYLNRDMGQALERAKNQPDLIYDFQEDERKLTNLHENIGPILEMNKQHEVSVFVGDRNNPTISRSIDIGRLKNTRDVVSCLASMIDLPFGFNHYIVSPGFDRNIYYIELLPETGAA
ncbi:ThiF family adenylyltransferase [Candidatus Pacearchaeota archaeon]|nr:ThiF family adenylyltransferase [Candidatus Pacearchaeota archaeon]